MATRRSTITTGVGTIGTVRICPPRSVSQRAWARVSGSLRKLSRQIALMLTPRRSACSLSCADAARASGRCAPPGLSDRHSVTAFAASSSSRPRTESRLSSRIAASARWWRCSSCSAASAAIAVRVASIWRCLAAASSSAAASRAERPTAGLTGHRVPSAWAEGLIRARSANSSRAERICWSVMPVSRASAATPRAGSVRTAW